jgi:transglutaminase-like putative cysteine protease
MRLKVYHATRYDYDSLPSHVVQRLHLEPVDFAGQRTVNWTITVPGSKDALRYQDGFGNWVHLVTFSPDNASVAIIAEGEVETEDTVGVVKGLLPAVPEAVFLRMTPATQPDKRLSDFASGFSGQKVGLDLAHAIMQAVHGTVAYELGSSNAHTTAAQAFAEKRGVCQDHAHIMLAICRSVGIPARYVTGYLVTGQGSSSTAAHAWAELFIADLGWVGFDASNGQCPTAHYVRVAAGHDAASISPVKGSRRGASGPEHLRVEVRVEISQQ